jgi:hypothetical protein
MSHHLTQQASAASPNGSDSSSGPCVQLARSFTHAAHQGPVRCLDAGGPWLVSGGQDDQLHIYDAKVCQLACVSIQCWSKQRRQYEEGRQCL